MKRDQLFISLAIFFLFLTVVFVITLGVGLVYLPGAELCNEEVAFFDVLMNNYEWKYHTVLVTSDVIKYNCCKTETVKEDGAWVKKEICVAKEKKK